MNGIVGNDLNLAPIAPIRRPAQKEGVPEDRLETEQIHRSIPSLLVTLLLKFNSVYCEYFQL